MATEIVAGPLGEDKAASTAGGGTALTTTATFIRLPLYTRHISITPRNFSAAVVVKLHRNPWLTVLKTTTALTTAPTDYSNAAQDLNAAAAGTVLSSLDTVANNNFLLIGATTPFRGVLVDVNATNSNAATLAVVYQKSDGTWANITPTDGTLAAGSTFAQDGNVTWTVPTDWTAAKLADIYASAPYFPAAQIPMFWTRWGVSAALDASVTLDRMLAMHRTTTYSEWLQDQVLEEKVLHGQAGGIGCIEALTDAGTANLIVNAFSIEKGRMVS